MKTIFNSKLFLALSVAVLLGCTQSELVFWPDMKWTRGRLNHSILSYQGGRFRWQGDLAILITKYGFLVSESAKNHETKFFYVDLLNDQLIAHPKFTDIAEYKNELTDQHWFNVATLIGELKLENEIKLFSAEIELLKRRIEHDVNAR